MIGGTAKPDHPATATPAHQSVAAGDTPDIAVSWQNLPAGKTYLGLVGYRDGTHTVGRTILTVSP